MDFNQAQMTALEHRDGPMMVLAGPGSGKTTVITHRIKRLLEAGVDPSGILVITFTKAAATEMKERFLRLAREEDEKRKQAEQRAGGSRTGAEKPFFGTADPGPRRREACGTSLEAAGSRVSFGTFHSVFYHILKWAYRFPVGNVISGEEKRQYFREFLDESEMEVEDEAEFISSIINEISYVKGERLDLKYYYSQNCPEEWFKKLYDGYDEMLKTTGKIDFDDMLVMCHELFTERKDILAAWQKKFKYILVDEFQDINLLQYQVVRMLALPENNLFIVGDDDQSIYRFRGANIKNILSFEETFPGAKVIKLEQNYRSTKMILDSANEVIKNNAGRKDKTLWTENEVGERPVFREFGSSFDEAEWVVRDIVKKGGPWKDYAILYRTNAQSRLFEEKCIAYNLPYRLVGGVNFYQRKEIKDILCYLKTIANGRDDLAVQRIINVPKRGIGAMSVARVNMFAMENDMSFYEALERVQAVPGIGKAALKIGVFTDQIGEFRKMLREEKTIKDVIEAVLEKTGYREELKEEGEVEAESRLENIEELINKAVSYWESADEPSLSEFLEEVALVADIDSMDESEDRIILMTLHSAKGLEFPYVYLVGMEDGLFPSMMSLMEGPEALEEERRLCYVGITRAEKRLTLTAAKSRMVKGEMQYARTSRFINEIPDVCLERPDQDDSKSGWRKTADAYKDLAEEAGLPWAKSADASGKAEGGHSGRFKDRPSGVSLFGQKSDAYKSPYASKTSGTPSSTPAFGKAFTVEKPKNLDYSEGDRVHHMRFGDGTVKAITDGGKDFEVTVEFDRETVGTRKMFASFAKLKKF